MFLGLNLFPHVLRLQFLKSLCIFLQLAQFNSLCLKKIVIMSPSSFFKATTVKIPVAEVPTDNVSSAPEVTLSQNVTSSSTTSHITMDIPTQTSSLISIGINIPPIDEVKDEFNEDFLVSLGQYRYSKAEKVVVRWGKKRGRVPNDVDMPMVNEVLWTSQSNDPQYYATYVTFVLGTFTGANMDAINSLNREFDKQKAEIISLKVALEKLKKQHEDKQDDLQLKNVALSEELQKEKNDNATLVQKVAVLERKIEYETTITASSSFSRFFQEEFKELAIRTNREHFDLVCE